MHDSNENTQPNSSLMIKLGPFYHQTNLSFFFNDEPVDVYDGTYSANTFGGKLKLEVKHKGVKLEGFPIEIMNFSNTRVSIVFEGMFSNLGSNSFIQQIQREQVQLQQHQHQQQLQLLQLQHHQNQLLLNQQNNQIYNHFKNPTSIQYQPFNYDPNYKLEKSTTIIQPNELMKNQFQKELSIQQTKQQQLETLKQKFLCLQDSDKKRLGTPEGTDDSSHWFLSGEIIDCFFHKLWVELDEELQEESVFIDPMFSHYINQTLHKDEKSKLRATIALDNFNQIFNNALKHGGKKIIIPMNQPDYHWFLIVISNRRGKKHD